MLENIRQILLTLRDLLIFILPKPIARLLAGRGEFVFLAHPIDLLPDIARKYPIANRMPKWLLKFISRYHLPIILGKIKGFHKKDGSLTEGWIVFCSLSTRMMVLKQELAKRKILSAAKFSEKLGGKILGLGAFVPIMTNDGRLLKGKVNMAITNGAAFSAVIAIQNVLNSSKMANLDLKQAKLAIIGAAGSVGSVCAKALIKYFNYLILVDKNINGLNKISAKLSKEFLDKSILQSTNISDIKNSDVILVVTNTPGVIVRATHLKKGAIVVDAAQPRNVSVKVPQERKDVIVIESGIAEVKGITVDCDIGFKKNTEVYSCLAEVLILTWLEVYEDHTGDVDFDYAMKLWKIAEKAGIEVAEFRNCLGKIEESTIANIVSGR